MAALTLEGHSGATVTIDLCEACQAFWFDAYESLQLAPRATLTLFSRIGELAQRGKQAIGPVLHCPRCRGHLVKTHDQQRATAFEYWRCPNAHGRFITAFNFLREKNFIKPLSAAELEELRQNVQTVNCSNCGSPVDVARGSACPHCGSPLSIVDMKQAQMLVDQLRQASAPKEIDPALPMNLLKARRDVEAAFTEFDSGRSWWRNASSSGLLEFGLAAVSRWLKNSG
jgi:hypothetical protein